MNILQEFDIFIEKLKEADPDFVKELKQKMIDFKKKQDLQLKKEMKEENNNE